MKSSRFQITRGQRLDGDMSYTEPVFRTIHLRYRDLVRLGRNWYNQTRGLRGQHINVHHVNNTDKVIAFLEKHVAEKVDFDHVLDGSDRMLTRYTREQNLDPFKGRRDAR